MCKKKHRTIPYTYQEVQEYIESFGYKLLSKEYTNANSKLSLMCDKGHEYNATFSKFKNGNRRCPYCAREKAGDSQRFDYKFVKEYIESFGYKLLSEEYLNTNEKLLVECPLGHKYNVTFHHFKGNENRKGRRCPYCNGGIKYTYEYVKEFIENRGYKLLSPEYRNCKEELLLQCPSGHNFKLTFDRLKNQECRCPICNVSKGEQKIINWLEENDIKFIYNKEYFKDLLGVRGGLLRPDFIIENKGIWIEYDGEFHFDKYYEGQSFEVMIVNDNIKRKYAEENGWRLIRIPYWEFDNIEEILEYEFSIDRRW